MEAITLDPTLLDRLAGKTAIVTGAAGGIGSEIVRLFAAHNANVVIADLSSAQAAAEQLISGLPQPSASTPERSRAIFVPVNILDWEQMKALFKTAIGTFGSVEIVVANAGIMESRQVLDAERVVVGDSGGEGIGDPMEPREGYRVIDVNVKGTLNSLLLGLHYMRRNPTSTFSDGSRGSIVLISSTSGYFGGTGVVGYITSKHAVTGLLRSSQLEATKHKIRVNAVAPFLTPSNMSAGFSQQYISRGLESNTPQGVARVVGTIAMDGTRRGCCFLTCGRIIREMEHSLKANIGVWLGEDTADLMIKAAAFFEDIGGYVLPGSNLVSK